MKHRKPVADRRVEMIRFRVTREQHKMFTAAAAHTGLTLSAWIVERAVREARYELCARRKTAKKVR